MAAVFEVDVKGLAQLVEGRGAGPLVAELVRNSLDEAGVTAVDVQVRPEPGRPLVRVVVADDAPGGFADLSHAYTLFSPSYKKAHAEKAGRFNLGDKLFLAAALSSGQEAVIKSTTGSVTFTPDGRVRGRDRTVTGSVVRAHLRVTRDEYEREVMPFLRSLIVPPGVRVTLNDAPLPPRTPVAEFPAELPTELADDEGVLRRRVRATTVRVYEPLPGETPSLYELGVPVVETGDRYHYDVAQKCPQNMNRDNVPPAYLRQLRTLVVNRLADRLTPADANAPWVREASSDARIDPAATATIVTLRFGEKRVIADPTDPEATKNATAHGYTVIHGGALNAAEWDNLRKAAAAVPAGQVFPTRHAYEGGPGAPSVEFVRPADFSPAVRLTVEYAGFLGRTLLGREVIVRVIDPACRLNHFAACWGSETDELHFNLWKLGHKWFGRVGPDAEDVDRLIVHELGHSFSGDHLSEAYHAGLCTLAARLKRAALADPGAFREFERRAAGLT
jgi:hypothetical protein